MSLTWQDFPGAPALGHPLCAVSDIPEAGVLALSVEGFPVLVLRVAGQFRAYVNACPHQFLPLTQRSTSILSHDGTRLICSNHNAEFLVENGLGVAGFALESCLAAIPTLVMGGQLTVG